MSSGRCRRLSSAQVNEARSLRHSAQCARKSFPGFFAFLPTSCEKFRSEIMGPFDFQLRTRVVFGEGRFEELGALARELGFGRTLVVADRGMVSVGYAARALERLAEA